RRARWGRGPAVGVGESLCIHDENGQHIGVVCRGGPYKDQVMVHYPWQRSWERIGSPVTRISDAFHMLGDALEANRASGWRYNRAGIWAVATEPSYYDPIQVYEVKVRWRPESFSSRMSCWRSSA